MHVTVFSKHQCRYCADAKALLDTKPNAVLSYVYLDEQPDYDEARAEMMRLMGLAADAPRPTLPQIFFAQEHFPGGASALLKLEADGELDHKLSLPGTPGAFPPKPSSGTWAWKTLEVDPSDF